VLIVLAHNKAKLNDPTPNLCTYGVDVSINRKQILWEGKIIHRRSDGVANLLRAIADAMDANANAKDSNPVKTDLE
jgi:hypothetical protein